MRTLFCFALLSLTSFALDPKPKKAPNLAPEWAETELKLRAAHRGSRYDARLPRAAVKDPDGDPLTFRLVPGSGPKWLKLDADGLFSGTPTAKDQGEQTWQIEARDAKHRATVKCTLSVENRAPKWTKARLELPEVVELKALKFSVAELASDPDGDKISFHKTAGPEWLLVDAKGKISGTPAEGSFGPYTATIEIRDGQTQSGLTLAGKVIQKNYAPTLVAMDPQKIKEREPLKLDLKIWTTDRNSDDKLSFSLKTPAAWYALSEKGILDANPGFKQIGSHTVAFTVTDGQLTTAGKIVIQVERNPRGPVWDKTIPVSNLKTREPFKASIGKLVKDLDGLPITLTKVSGPAWLTLSPQGELSGTPADADAGQTPLVVRAANDVAANEQTFAFTITKKNYPPQLIKALEQTVKEREITRLKLPELGLVNDGDNEPLFYTATKLPPFASLHLSGELSLGPQFAHIGTYQFTIAAKDREASAEIPVTLIVQRNPRAPVWVEQDLAFKVQTREAFKIPTATYVKDLDGKAIKITKKSGPEWLLVSPSGDLSGEPTDAQGGKQRIELLADNGEMASEKRITLDVKVTNHPPVVRAEGWKFSCKERSPCRFDLSRKEYVSDADSDRLKFTLLDPKGAAWVQLTPDGEITFTGGFKEIGDHGLTVEIVDAETKATATGSVHFDRDPRPPVWNSGPFVFRAKARETFKDTLAGKAKDLDGLPIRFELKKGPSWLTVGPEGALHGQPTDEAIGEVEALISVANDKLAAQTEITIHVLAKNKPPSWTQNQMELGSLRAGDNLKTTVARYATDPDPLDKLTFEKVQGPAWVIVAPNGQVFGRPEKGDVGEAKVVVRVLDAERELAEAVAMVKVQPMSARPTPKQNPIRLPDAYPGELFAYSLFPVFGNDSGLKYRLVNGPKWLLLRPTGEFAGIPVGSGDFDFVVEVTNGRETVEFKGKGKIAAP